MIVNNTNSLREVIFLKQFYQLSNSIKAVAHRQMQSQTVRNLWDRFTQGQTVIEFLPCDANFFRIGEPRMPVLEQDKEYALSVDENGCAVVGRDFGGLMRGFFVLLMKLEPYEGKYILRCACHQSSYVLKNRMIHICVFPENDLYFIKKLIRFAALCQYTHIVIEFWGMLRYDCLKELAWPHAFTKAEAGELIRECRELGMEPVPMFNQLGHATASRLRYGKHVVLDQDPRLEHLFTPDGWAWNIESPQVKALLRSVRSELYELFGPGEYMHIGCDEAYYISRNPRVRAKLPQYLHDLTYEVQQEGRRPMLWMDMLLEKDAFKDCYAAGEKDEVEVLRKACADSSVFVDWQYGCVEVPVPSLLSLKDCGKDVMGAPWNHPDNYRAHISTVTEDHMHGIMLTTWDTLKTHIHSILDCAKCCGASTFYWSEFSGLQEETATLLRKVSFEGNSYESSGWSKEQIEC